MPGFFAGAADTEEMSWSFDSETGKLTLSGNGPMEKFIEIGNGAVPWYEYSDSIKELYINEGITTICQPAFVESESLEKVTIPSSVKKIADNAFLYCEALENIAIPDGVVEIGESAFNGCLSLKTVIIGKDLTEIGHYAFYYCPSLESFTVSSDNTAFSSDEYGVLFNKDKTELIQYPIGNTRDTYNVPDGVKNIAAESFMDASALANISLPDSVTYIGGNPFGGTVFFDTPANWKDGILYINDKYLISAGYTGEPSGAYEVREGTKVIAGCAFMNCGLTSITIPASVVSVGESAFRCENLSEIIVDEKSEYLTSVDNVLFTKDMSELVYYPMAKTETSYEIPSGVTRIADFAFELSTLSDIVIPEGVTEIGELAFCANYGLSEVTLPESLINIAYSAFYYCTELKTVSFGSELQSIDKNAFFECGIKDVYYNGTEKDWKKVIIISGNDALFNAEFHALHIELEANNIIISYPAGCFDEEVTFSIEDLNGTSDEIPGGIYDTENRKRIGLYSIKPLNAASEVVQPTGKVEIRLPFTKVEEEDVTYIIYHVFMDGVREKFTTNPKAATDKLLRIVDGYYVIEVDHFSEFVICAELNETGSEPAEKTVTSISIATLPSKTSYTYKSGNLDLSGIALTVTYSDGTTETVTDTSKMNVSGFDNSKTGKQAITVEYEGATTSFDVTVSYAWWQWIIRVLLLGFLWY